jgi:hypothetical protein
LAFWKQMQKGGVLQEGADYTRSGFSRL